MRIFCTLSIFLALVGALVVGSIVKVPFPTTVGGLWIPTPLLLAIAGWALIVAVPSVFIVGLWYAAADLCAYLRARVGRGDGRG